MFQLADFESVMPMVSTLTLPCVMSLICFGSSVVVENDGVVSSGLPAPKGATPNSTSG